MHSKMVTSRRGHLRCFLSEYDDYATLDGTWVDNQQCVRSIVALTPPVIDWEEPPIPPEDLIFDDGEPLETHRHRKAMNVLIDSIEQAYQDREDFFVGGNMFIYFSRERVFNKDFRGPDFFVVLDIDGSYKRQGWVVWNENGRYPDVIVELMSESTAKIDLTTKKDLYERTFRCSSRGGRGILHFFISLMAAKFLSALPALLPKISRWYFGDSSSHFR